MVQPRKTVIKRPNMTEKNVDSDVNHQIKQIRQNLSMYTHCILDDRNKTIEITHIFIINENGLQQQVDNA